jgi:hypothetical protein
MTRIPSGRRHDGTAATALALTSLVVLGCGTGVYDDPLRPDPRSPGQLDGQKFMVPCGAISSYSELLCDHVADDACAAQGTTPPGREFVGRDDSILFPGTPGLVYNVTLRVRGVVESNIYFGGTPSATEDNPDFGLYTGGRTSTVGQSHVYQLSVSAPKEVYYLNALQHRQMHAAFPVDYIFTIPIAAYAEIGFRQWDSDCRMVRNCDEASTEGPPGEGICHPSPVPDLAWIGQPYDGQFLLLNVIGLTF